MGVKEGESSMLSVIESLRIPQKFKNKIEHDLEIILKADLANLEQILLFGSCARESVTALSDVDLMVVTTTPIEERHVRYALYDLVCDEWGGVESDLVFTTREARETSQSAFTRFTKEEAVILWERGKCYD